MEKVIQQALDSQYEEYFFVGSPKGEKGVIDLETSQDEMAALSLFCSLQMAENSMKWNLLDAALQAFSFASDDEYAIFLQHIKTTKRSRMENVRKGRIPVVTKKTNQTR